MKREELEALLEKHQLWRRRDPSGARANLAHADLAGANLARANLAHADLARANLAHANLAHANLADANLAGANLAGAYLVGAYLARARSLPANIETVDPPEPYDRSRHTERRSARAKLYRESHPDVPFVENLDQRILDAIDKGGTLEMGLWHSCETTHCRAGWAVHIAGEQGYALERSLGGPEYAGRAIYLASTGRVPHFYASNEQALEDIKRCAEEQS